MLMEYTLGFSGKRLKELRQTRGFTAMELAKQAGVSEDAVRKVESGRSKQPSFETGVRIAQALGIDSAELAFGKPAGRETDLLARAIQALRSKKTELLEFGIQHAAVFGSAARGEATPESDIDILLQPGDTALSLFSQAEIGGLLESSLHRNVDIMTSPRAQLNGFTNILDEAVYAF
jgi:predicted nucleotidyltransferase